MTHKELIAFQKQLDHRFESFCKTGKQEAKTSFDFLAEEDNLKGLRFQDQIKEESHALPDINQEIETYSCPKKMQNNVKEISSTEESMEDTLQKGQAQKK